MALYKRKNIITLLQMDGLAPKEEVKELIKLALKGCEIVYEKQRSALKKEYSVDEKEAGK